MKHRSAMRTCLPLPLSGEDLGCALPLPFLCRWEESIEMQNFFRHEALRLPLGGAADEGQPFVAKLKLYRIAIERKTQFFGKKVFL